MSGTLSPDEVAAVVGFGLSVAYRVSGATLDGDVWLGDLMDLENRAAGTGFALNAPSSASSGWLMGEYAFLRNAGDTTGDGIDDLLMSFEYFHKAFYVIPGGARDEDVDLASPVASGVRKIWGGRYTWSFSDDASGIRDWLTEGRMIQFSHPSAGGDLNGDGLADIVAFSWEVEDGNPQVEFAVVHGSPDTSQYALDQADAGDGGFVVEGLPGVGTLKDFGDTLSTGDLDGDGLDDAAFWIQLTGDGAPAARLYILWGRTGTDTVPLSALEDGTAGRVVDLSTNPTTLDSADIDGDGLDDLIVGFATADDQANNAGRVEVLFGLDDQDLVTQRGTAGADELVGTSGVDRIVAGRGDDVLDGQGGADVLYGGAGDDRILIGDDGFFRVRGGLGFDTLALPVGVSLDLVARRGRVEGIEQIDLAGGGHTLTLAAVDVLRLADASKILAVLGDGTDTVDAQEGDWTAEGDVDWDGTPLRAYRDGQALLLLSPAIDSRLKPTFTELAFEVAEGAPDGTVVGSASAVDPDGTSVSLELTAGDPYGAFVFDVQTGALTVADGSLLDHETRETWTMQVTATDDDGLSNTGTIVVTVLDAPEAPVFYGSPPVASVPELADDGTVVTSVLAWDPDPGDSLTYAIVGGDDAGAFAIDGATGVIAVRDGTLLDYETTPSYTLTVRATDSTGLFAETEADVVLDDVDVVEQDATWTFATSGRSIWAKNAVVGETQDVVQQSQVFSIDEDWGDSTGSFLTGSGIPLNLWGTLAMTSQMNFDVQASSGEVNASLPIHVSTVTPDGVRLGEPFTIETSWTLDDAASMWGETFMLDAAIRMDLENVTLGIHYEVGNDTGGADVGPFDYSLPSVDWEIDAQQFQSLLYRDVFPNGATWTPDTSSASCDENIGDTVCSVSAGLDLYDDMLDAFSCDPDEECDYRQGDLWDYLADGDDNLLITDNVHTKALDMYVDPQNFALNFFRWSDVMNLALAQALDDGDVDDPTVYLNLRNLLWGTLTYQIGDVGYVYFFWRLLFDWVKLQVTSEEMFMLDVQQVTATYRFENGTEVTGALGDALTVTLPSDEDANGDGRVDVTITYTVDARFYHVVLVVPTIKWGAVRLGLEAAAYDYEYDLVDGQIQKVGETRTFHDSFGPVYEGEWNFNLSIEDFTRSWKMQGFNTATTRGALQIAP